MQFCDPLKQSLMRGQKNRTGHTILKYGTLAY